MANIRKMKNYRGSQKHILDWVEDPEFPKQLTEMLVPTGAVVTPDDTWMPLGHHDPKEARLESFGPAALPELINWGILSDWWLIHKRCANTPNWDLASTCNINGQKGLVLVEAKANASELKVDGKVLDPSASENSKENHKKISQAINEANEALNQIVPGVSISRDSHYQLANRIAFSWKIASLGDHKEIGLTRGEYRGAIERLENHQLITTKKTNKGTRAKLINSDIFNINEEKVDHQEINRSAREGPFQDHRPTTNNNENNSNNDKNKTKRFTNPQGGKNERRFREKTFRNGSETKTETKTKDSKYD